MFFNFVTWNPNSVFVNLGGFEIRWYGVLFGLAFVAGFLVMSRIFKKEGIDSKHLDSMTIWIVAFTFIGARLGHVLFYEPAKYLADPILILNLREGGLASHGAAFGLIFGMWLYSRFVIKKPFLWTTDRVVIIVALSGLFIRSGNLINGEIIGKETTKPWGFVFMSPMAGDQNLPYLGGTWKGNDIRLSMEWELNSPETKFEIWKSSRKNERGEKIAEITAIGKTGIYLDKNPGKQPVFYSVYEAGQFEPYATAWITARHPAQIYEAVFYFLVFLFLLWYYFRLNGVVPPGLIFGLFFFLVFGFRFFIEFLKADQVDFEANLPLNMGQWLSLPFALMGLGMAVRAKLKQSKN